MLEEIKRR